MRYIFIVHHSVFHDAFRTDYETPFKSSSKDFFDLLFQNKIDEKKKIAYTSGEVFEKLHKSPIGKTNIIWAIPEDLVEIRKIGGNEDGNSINKKRSRINHS